MLVTTCAPRSRLAPLDDATRKRDEDPFTDRIADVGGPMVADGNHAAFRRVNPTTDRRSNMRVGGEPEPVEVDDAMLRVAEAVRPKLLADGMFLVGLDIVGDKLMEVNVLSPGGLGNCETL